MMNLGGAMQVNPAMVLHGEQGIADATRPIPTSGTLTTTPTIKAVYDKGKGAVVVVETDTVDAKGKLIFRNTSSASSSVARAASAATAARAVTATCPRTARRTSRSA